MVREGVKVLGQGEWEGARADGGREEQAEQSRGQCSRGGL